MHVVGSGAKDLLEGLSKDVDDQHMYEHITRVCDMSIYVTRSQTELDQVNKPQRATS